MMKRKKYKIIIDNDEKKKIQESISFFTVIFTISIWVLQFYLTKLFDRSSFQELDYWMIELFIVSYINSKMFKIKVYKHQKCAIYYNCFFCTLLELISVIISILIDNYNENNLYKTKPYLIPIIVIIYFLI